MKKILLVCVMAACGGGGGPNDSSKEFKDLTPAEATAECNYLADEYPARDVTCPGESDPRTVGTDKAECANATTDDVPDTCTATVGQFEDCDAALYALSDNEICNLTSIPPACAPLFSSDCQSTDSSARTNVLEHVRHVGALLAR